MKSYLKYYSGELTIVPKLYHNGHTCLQLVDTETGEPAATATINIDNEVLISFDTVAIKDYSENEGVYKTLHAAGIIDNPITTAPTGYKSVPVCKIIDEDLLDEIQQMLIGTTNANT